MNGTHAIALCVSTTNELVSVFHRIMLCIDMDMGHLCNDSILVWSSSIGSNYIYYLFDYQYIWWSYSSVDSCIFIQKI